MIDTIRAPARESGEPKGQSESSANSADALAQLEGDREVHLRELDELRSELMQQAEAEAEEADPVMDEKAKDMALLHHLEEHVAEIDHALAAAKEGIYGVCELCHQPIDRERLRVLPETRLCIRCKSQLERTTHHHRRHS